MRKTFLLLFASALSFVSCNKEGEIFGDGNDQDVAETLLTRSRWMQCSGHWICLRQIIRR